MAEFSWLDVLASHDKDAPLLVVGQRRWRAAEIADELRALQPRLAESNVVAVLADNGLGWVMADLGTQVAGKVHLPLPAFFTQAQLRHALELSAADTILTDTPERIGALDLGFCHTGRWQGLYWMRRIVPAVSLPEGTAKISYTSGSTGTPKGVCLSREGLLDTASAVGEATSALALECHLAALPLGLLLENVAGVYAALLRGIPVHLPSLGDIGWQGGAGFDPAQLDAVVRASGATSLILVPELLKVWSLWLAARGRMASERLRFVAVGGARVAPGLLELARARGIPAYQGYGFTEAGSVVSLNVPGDDAEDAGSPLPHVQLSVREGEVVVQARAFLGYVGGERATSGAFASGDLGHLDNRGHLQLDGRRGNLLITSFGRNVSPEWVESLLLADACVAQAVVVGDGRPQLAALIVPSPGTDPAALAALIDRVNAALPDYARVRHWLAVPPFTVENGLVTGNGRPVRTRVLEHHSTQIDALYVASSNETKANEKEANDVLL